MYYAKWVQVSNVWENPDLQQLNANSTYKTINLKLNILLKMSISMKQLLRLLSTDPFLSIIIKSLLKIIIISSYFWVNMKSTRNQELKYWFGACNFAMHIKLQIPVHKDTEYFLSFISIVFWWKTPLTLVTVVFIFINCMLECERVVDLICAFLHCLTLV